MLLRYANFFPVMVQQHAACNVMRQQFMAAMLGVQRPTVSTTAYMLQKAGLITYTRGHKKVLNEDGLINGACPCYELMEREVDKIYEVPWRKMIRQLDHNHRPS